MYETNAELEEMGTIEACDEAYERTRETVTIDDFMYEYEYDEYDWDV